MRTLKKTLCLVLALVLCFGLVGTAFAGNFDGYTDADKVGDAYEEAAAVMMGIGVINGMSETVIDPTGTLTREQAAKIVAYMVLGGDVADKLQADKAPFDDVAATKWSAGYIAYCVREGIIAGYGDGTFGPADELTGYQFAAMILRALGFGKDGEYEGSGWSINVAKDAFQNGLFEGDASAAVNAPIERQQAMLMAFNGLNYSANGTGEKMWTITGIDGGKVTYGWVTIPGTATDSLAATVYKLSADTTASDSLGRPATTWKQNGKTIATYAEDADLVITSDVANVNELNKILKDAGYTIAGTVSNTYNAATPAATGDRLSSNIYSGADWAGNGNVVELYDTDDNNVIDTVVVIKPSFAQVSVTSVPATRTHGAYTRYTVGGKTGNVFSTVVTDNDKDSAFVTGSVADKNMVLYYTDPAGNLYIEAVSTITGTLTSVSNAGVYTIDGTAYELAACGDTSIVASKNAQTFYVDSYGYILDTVTAVTPTDYAMVLSLDTYSTLNNGKIETAYSAVIANVDGSVETLAIEKASYDALHAANVTNGANVGAIVTYADSNANGLYELSGVHGSTGATSVLSCLTQVGKGTALNVYTGDGNWSSYNNVLYANNSTVYVVKNYVTDTNGNRVSDGTVTIYNGQANAPVLAGTYAYALDTGVTKDKIADVVFVNADTSAAATSQYIYVTGNYSVTAGSVYNYEVIINGTASTISFSKQTAGLTGVNALSAGLYTTLTVTGDTLTAAVNASTDGTITRYTSVQNNGGLLFVGGNYSGDTIADTTPVYVFDTVGKSVIALTAADITTPYTVNGGDYIVYTADATGTTVTAVYILNSSL